MLSSVGRLTQNVSIAYGVQIEALIGGAGGDIVDGGAGADLLAGADMLDGGSADAAIINECSFIDRASGVSRVVGGSYAYKIFGAEASEVFVGCSAHQAPTLFQAAQMSLSTTSQALGQARCSHITVFVIHASTGVASSVCCLGSCAYGRKISAIAHT